MGMKLARNRTIRSRKCSFLFNHVVCYQNELRNAILNVIELRIEWNWNFKIHSINGKSSNNFHLMYNAIISWIHNRLNSVYLIMIFHIQYFDSIQHPIFTFSLYCVMTAWNKWWLELAFFHVSWLSSDVQMNL